MIDKEQAFEQLRCAGLRLTPQRRVVVDVLVGNRAHPTADQVAAQAMDALPGLSLSTVYKVLHELDALGLIRSVEVPGAMRFDADATDHMHVVCEDCGSISDAPIPSDARASLVSAGGSGISLNRIDVVLRGTCSACS